MEVYLCNFQKKHVRRDRYNNKNKKPMEKTFKLLAIIFFIKK